MQNNDEGNGYAHPWRVEFILKKILLLLNDDPRVKIIKLLAESPADDTYVSFRTIARRIGINYNKLRRYLSQLEAAGFVDSIKINAISNNTRNGNNNKGYTYYKLRQETKDIIKRVLSYEKVSTYYPYIALLTLTLITTRI